MQTGFSACFMVFLYNFESEKFPLNFDVLFCACFLFTNSVYRYFIDARFYSVFAAFYSMDFDHAALSIV